MACLSSRVPYGETVSPEKLNMIEQAEYVLRDLGFYDVRVRHHELRAAPPQAPPARDPVLGLMQPFRPSNAESGIAHLARIEVGPGELGKFLVDNLPARVTEALKEIGYQHVTLDLQGYRRGSANEAPVRSSVLVEA
jgi:uncharacterized protein